MMTMTRLDLIQLDYLIEALTRRMIRLMAVYYLDGLK